jgi:hypothetical protein
MCGSPDSAWKPKVRRFIEVHMSRIAFCFFLPTYVFALVWAWVTYVSHHLIINIYFTPVCTIEYSKPLFVQSNTQQGFDHKLTYSITAAFPAEIQIRHPKLLTDKMLQRYSLRLRIYLWCKKYHTAFQAPAFQAPLLGINDPSDDTNNRQRLHPHPPLKIFFYFIPKIVWILKYSKTNKKVKLLHYKYCEL